VVFLDLNGHAPDLDEDAAFDLVTDAARGAADVEEIASRLQVVPVTAG
jgi:death-on-curing protein